MSDIRVPKGALIGAAMLIGFVVTTITVARQTETGLLETGPVEADEARALVFRPQDNGEMLVFDAGGRAVARLVVEGDTFTMTAVRALAMQRPDRAGDEEYRLEIRRDAAGHIELADPETGRTVRIEGFGEASKRKFAGLLD